MVLSKKAASKSLHVLFRKKGQSDLVPSEVAKAVLSIGVVLLLIGLLVALFGMFSKNAQLEQAKASLDKIVQVIKSMESNNVVNYLIESPRDWVVVKPFDSKNSLCICPLVESTFSLDKYYQLQSDLCYKSGTCVSLTQPLKISGVCGKNIPDCLALSNVPYEISVQRTETELIISPNEISAESEFMTNFFSDKNSISVFSKWVNSDYAKAEQENLRKSINSNFAKPWCLTLFGEGSLSFSKIHTLSSSSEKDCDALKLGDADKSRKDYQRLVAFKDDNGVVQTYFVSFRSFSP